MAALACLHSLWQGSTTQPPNKPSCTAGSEQPALPFSTNCYRPQPQPQPQPSCSSSLVQQPGQRNEQPVLDHARDVHGQGAGLADEQEHGHVEACGRAGVEEGRHVSSVVWTAAAAAAACCGCHSSWLLLHFGHSACPAPRIACRKRGAEPHRPSQPPSIPPSPRAAHRMPPARW